MTGRLISVNEACGILGIGRTKFYALKNAGEITTGLIGSRRLVQEASVYAFIENILADEKPVGSDDNDCASKCSEHTRRTNRKNRQKNFQPDDPAPSEVEPSSLCNTYTAPPALPKQPKGHLGSDSFPNKNSEGEA